jgi:hypothetical protein
MCNRMIWSEPDEDSPQDAPRRPSTAVMVLAAAIWFVALYWLP